MDSANVRIGFIGLGVMGRPMVTHLAKAGHEVTLYDRVAGLAEEIAATLPGARVAARPAALAASGLEHHLRDRDSLCRNHCAQQGVAANREQKYCGDGVERHDPVDQRPRANCLLGPQRVVKR